MNKNRLISPNVFFGLAIVITAAIVVDPNWAFAQTPSSGETAATSSPLSPPPPPLPNDPQPPAGQGTPPVAYPNAWGPNPPVVPNDPAYNKMYPKELPYEEGAEVPLGYRKVEKSRKALLIAGTATFAAFYSITLFGALLSSEPKYAVPVIGPFLGVERTSGDSFDVLVTSTANILFVFDGLAQAAGVAMLIAGIPTKTTLVRNDVATFKPEFSVGPGSISMRMRF